jgi:hypothetical protein
MSHHLGYLVMQRRQLFILGVAVAIAACHDATTGPTALSAGPTPASARAAPPQGTGLVLHNVTSTPIPLLDNAVLNGEVVITQLALNAVGGLTASGTLTGTITGVSQTITQDFTTDVAISGSGNGNSCSVLTVDLSPINVDAGGQIVSVDLTQVNATVGAQGPLGSLLCTLTNLVNRGVGGAVSALLSVINSILGGGTPTPPPVP